MRQNVLTIKQEIFIAQPPETVWDYTQNYDKRSQWDSGVIAASVLQTFLFKGLMQGQKASFPDIRHEAVQIFSSGNLVCVSGIFSGTNTGSMQGNPPTGNKVVLPFIFIDEFDASGKVKTRYVQFDTGSFNAQLMGKK